MARRCPWWSELRSQVAAERWRGVILAVLAAALVAAVVVVELTAIHRALEADAALQAAGRDVFVATPTRSGGFGAARCSALGANPQVVAAGGFTLRDETTALAKAPGDPLRLVGVTGDLPTILTGQPSALAPGIALTATDADRLGVADGDPVTLIEQHAPVSARVLDVTARVADPGPWVMHQVAGDPELDACWVEVRPGGVTAAKDFVASSLTVPGAEIVVVPLLGEDRLRQSPLAQYQQRATKNMWLLVGAGLGLLFALVLWFRRAEVALYRTVGVSRLGTAVVHGGQCAPFLAIGMLAGTLAGLIATTGEGSLTGELVGAAVRQATLTGLTAWVVIILSALALTLGRLAAYIRDRL